MNVSFIGHMLQWKKDLILQNENTTALIVATKTP